MSEFERELSAFRLVQTHYGDDLQAVAGRELGDANRWPELIWLNQLVYPYLTDDESLASDRVLLNGSYIRVPSPQGSATIEQEPVEVFARDCGLWDRSLAANENGDFAVTSGVDNLKQQLRHAINTPRGQQKRHPEYGCLVWSLFGTVNGPAAGRLGGEYVKATIRSDYRINRVISVVADVTGDQLRVTAKAEAISGEIIDLTNEFPDQQVDEPSEQERLIMYFDLLHEFVHHKLPTYVSG
ncbi:baseplate wedge protein [Pseudomonas phage Dolphis]|nr:baseplate wedge protein [Pseudomonas phage Dolphis]